MEKVIEKAKILMQALPYIKQYRGKKVLIKFGGKAMQDKQMEQSIANDLVMMRYVGIFPVVVHGGGQGISAYMEKQGLKPRFIDGLRVTDEETLKIVKEVLVNQINREIVKNINKHGELAVGIADEDGLIEARKKEHQAADLGYVGKVSAINKFVIEGVISNGKIPVVASIGIGADGHSYNINADAVAWALASALECEKIIYLTNVDGVYKDLNKENSLISALSYEECQKLVEDKVVEAGMLPKVLSCMRALEYGVHRAHILNGTVEHALLLEIFTDEGIGTMIEQEARGETCPPVPGSGRGGREV